MTATQIGGLHPPTAFRATMFFRALCATALFALASPASAQTGLYFGNRFGLLRSDLSGDAVASSESRDIGMPFNVMLGVQLTRFVGVQAELNVTERGGSEFVGAGGFDPGTSDFSVGYVEVPLLVRLQVPVENGPYAAAFGGAALAFRTGKSDLSGRFSSTVPSAVFGGEVGLASGGARAFVVARYNVGLGGLLDDEAFGGTAPDLTAGGLAVTVGGAFNLSTLLGGGR